MRSFLFGITLPAIPSANGWKMTATYNSLGRMTHETWYLNDVEKARYIYAYNGAGNIVRSIDKYALKEYNYRYEEEKLTHSAEYSISLNASEIVTEKILLNTVHYFYTKDGQLERKLIEDCDGNSFEYRYEYPEDGEPIVCYKVNGQIVRSQSESDHLGRKVFDELQLGKANLYRKFSYADGVATPKHVEEGAVQSKPTTTLVSKIEFADGRTIEYEYDKEERITKVIDSVDGITVYDYDSLGQLKTETVNGTVVNEMTYDNYGNITEKNGVAYTYDTSGVWKDLLIKVGAQEIAYDVNGNPTTYLGHDLTWEKGRQLKSYDNNTYTYNANGIRTSKKINGVKHEYTLDGTKILRETWDGNTLAPLYDNEDSVCGILYNDVPYYFIKNLQGDIIAIVDKDAQTVARYSYDAWGVPTITQDTSDCQIATINPFRYRGYYYDEEIALYYLQSRYYDAGVGRFLNADKLFDSQILLLGNIIFYCNNNPINFVDSQGDFALEAAAGTLLVAGGTNSWNPVGWVLLAVAAVLIVTVLVVGACAVAVEISNSKSVEKAKTKNNTKTLKDVKVRKQYGKQYQLAYISTYGALVKLFKKMSFTEALACLGITGATNSISQTFTYDRGKASDAQRQLEHLGKGEWGIYSHSQYAAKALATVFGCTEPPEVHGSGMYGHYHDSTHTFHIWYGGMINRF